MEDYIQSIYKVYTKTIYFLSYLQELIIQEIPLFFDTMHFGYSM